VQVASEDTILAAVREYVKANSPRTAAGNLALGPLIRCQHLSMYWLSACALWGDEGLSALFSPFKKPLKKLLMMRLADSNYVPAVDQLQQRLDGAPASWGLRKRTFRSVHDVKLVWPLPIAELRSAVQRSCDEQHVVEVKCPLVSAPLGGLTWSMWVEADWDADRKGTQIKLFCIPRNAPRDVYYRYMFRIDVEGAPQLSQSVSCSRVLQANEGAGARNVFGAGPMSKGWDAEAWAAAGLPAQGELRVTLTVTAVNNAGRNGKWF
jgi:hypothetical protein